MMRNSMGGTWGVVVVVVCAGGANAQAQFHALGVAPVGPSGSSSPVAKAADNTGAVLGILGNGAFMWTVQNGYVFLPVLNSGYGMVNSTTGDGTVTYGMNWTVGSAPYPVVWHSRTQAPTPVPNFPAGWTCFGAAGDVTGTLVSGLMRQGTVPFEYQSYFWNASTGMEFVSSFPVGATQAYVADFADNGSIGIGNAFGGGVSQGARWTGAGGFVLLGDAAGGTEHSALNSIDAQGWRASGTATPESNKPTAAVWDPRSGWVVVGVLHPADTGSDLTLAGSGYVGVGQSGYGSNPRPNAIIWTVRDGVRSLQDVLEQDHGLDLGGWHLAGADAVSADGRFIAGEGYTPQGEFELWLAELPEFCYADCDANGTMNIFDYICFGNHVSQQDVYANCNNDMQINVFDYICFGNAYAGGCP